MLKKPKRNFSYLFNFALFFTAYPIILLNKFTSIRSINSNIYFMSLFKKRRSSDIDESSEINISPLLDMVFILLIFFVVTTTFTRETGVEVKKPKASSATQIKDKTLKVAITREGTIHIHEKQVNLNVLEAILRREYARNPSVKVIIIADNQSITGMLVKVLDKCNLVGLRNTSVAALNET